MIINYAIMREVYIIYLKTEIAKDIEIAKYRIRYDTQCKRVLGNKIILSWIMKETIKEFSNMSINSIYRCIEQNPSIDEVYAEPGQTNTNEKIAGINTEDKIQNEGSITYDIRFEAYVPKEEEKVKIIINVEAQKNFYPGYPIISRGIYYGARMVSAQGGVEFREPDYGNIKKVYSIWICMGVPRYIGNAISVYDMKKTDIIGNIPDIPANYDKICIVMVCLDEHSKSENTFLNMMNTLLSSYLDVSTKKRILQNEYQIPMNDNLGEEMNLMCNLSEYVWERGVEAGRKEALQSVVGKMLKTDSASDDFIMDIAGISKAELEKIKAQM